MIYPKPITASPEGLFEAFRQGRSLSEEVAASHEIGSNAVGMEGDLEAITARATELAVDQSVAVSAIDGDKSPFVLCFSTNPLSVTKGALGDLRKIPGNDRSFQANEEYSMTWFPSYYRNVYPLRGKIKGKVVGVDLGTSDLIVKRRFNIDDTVFGSRTWVKLLGPDGETPLVKVDFL